ncbi:hypothetical protein SLE2022_167630 [Rubroshorea leprosula]
MIGLFGMEELVAAVGLFLSPLIEKKAKLVMRDLVVTSGSDVDDGKRMIGGLLRKLLPTVVVDPRSFRLELQMRIGVWDVGMQVETPMVGLEECFDSNFVGLVG